MKKLALGSALLLALVGGCASGASSSQLEGDATALVSVSAESLEDLRDSESFVIDLRRSDVVYEIDGTSAPVDLDRLTIITPESDSVTMRDYIVPLGDSFNEQDFTLRLSSDSEALAESSTLGSTSQALKKGPGRGPGGTSYTCPPSFPPFCSCTGDDDCNGMLGPNGPCGGGGTLCDETSCVCFP